MHFLEMPSNFKSLKYKDLKCRIFIVASKNCNFLEAPCHKRNFFHLQKLFLIFATPLLSNVFAGRFYFREPFTAFHFFGIFLHLLCLKMGPLKVRKLDLPLTR